MELVEQIVDDRLRVLLRDYADAALDVETEDESVNDHTAAICTENAEHDGFGVVADRGREGDHQARDRNCSSELHLEVLVHDLRDDVESARRGVDGKQNCHCKTDDEEVADHIEEGILGQRLEIGENDLKYAKGSGHEDGGIDRFCSEFGSNEQKSHRQKDDIQRKRDHRDGQGDEVREHHCKCRSASDGKMRGKHKEIDRRRSHHRAEGYDKVFLDSSFNHGFTPFLPYYIYYITFSEKVHSFK